MKNSPQEQEILPAEREYPGDEAWYVAFVLTGSEETVSQRLAKMIPGSEVLVPRRILRERTLGRWHTAEKIVFPGYVFFKTSLTNERHFLISHLTGVIRILEQNHKPQPVGIGEMTQLLHLMDHNGLIGFSRVTQNEGKVIVNSGPLLGCEGLIIGADRRKGRIKIRLLINGQSKNIDVGAQWISETEE